MYKLEVRHKIDASHQLTDSPFLVTKECARLHGHSYAFRVFVETKELNDGDMIVDFKAIKKIIDVLDHRHINDVFAEHGYKHQPTAERISAFISNLISSELGLVDVEVWVAEGYKGEEFSSWAKYNA